MIKPFNRYKYDEQEMIRDVLTDLGDANCNLDDVVCDNPKRAIIRCAKNHASLYACELCENMSMSIKSKTIVQPQNDQKKCIENQITVIQSKSDLTNEDNKNITVLYSILANLQKEKSRKQLAWPYSTKTENPRTIDNILQIVNNIELAKEQNVTLPLRDTVGFTGRSHLLQFPNFDFINNIVGEYMHGTCFGLGKRLIELIYNCGEARQRVTKRKLNNVCDFNNRIKTIQVPREFSRRCRNLDFGVWKAAEFRNCLLFFWPIILECISENWPKELRVWLNLVFLIRSHVIPNDEFVHVPVREYEKAADQFYKLFEQCYGKKNCSYSVHLVASHLTQIRGDEPLTEKSAFKYENFYGQMKNLFQPGTTSPLKQILQNMLMKQILDYHCCEKNIFYSTKPKGKCTKKESNHMIYIMNNDKHEFYNILQSFNDHFICEKQGKFVYNHPLTTLNWSTVGVYKVGPTSTTRHKIMKQFVCGKVIRVLNFLITCPSNVLLET